MARAPFWPGFGRFLRYRKDLGQFATALGGGDGEEFIICAASPAQSEVARSKNALQMRKQHLDLLSLLHRDTVLLGLGAVTSHLAGVFIFCPGDLARIVVRAAVAFDGQAQQRPCAVGRVDNQRFWIQIELGIHLPERGLCRSELDLSDRAQQIDIKDDTMVCVDQAIVGMAQERKPFACCRPLAGRTGMRSELGLYFAGRTKRGLRYQL